MQVPIQKMKKAAHKSGSGHNRVYRSDCILHLFSGFFVVFVQGFAKVREEDDLADIAVIGQEHNQAVDAHAEAAHGGHAIRHSPQIVLVHGVAFFFALSVFPAHLSEAFFLLEGVIQFRKGISQFDTAYEKASKRSTVLGSSGLFLASGEMSLG